MEVVIITGLSGAGKTQAIICMEDLGYYCIDNMPPALIQNFIDLAATGRRNLEKVAFVIDIRGGEFFEDLQNGLKDLRKNGLPYKIIFLEAKDEVLIRRYHETRRAHPLAEGGNAKVGIERERESLEDLRQIANCIIDTSNMKAAKLREEIKKVFTDDESESNFTINIESFGYKNGIPLEVDMIFDLRFIPNPFYMSSLKTLTGNNQKVRSYVMKHPESIMFLEQVVDLINKLIPSYIKEGKYHLNIGFGCTGGQHRSVTLANEFAEIMKAQGTRITLEHRDL